MAFTQFAISLILGASLALVIGLRKPPITISLLLLASIITLYVGLSALLGAFESGLIYVTVVIVGYLVGYLASLLPRMGGRRLKQPLVRGRRRIEAAVPSQYLQLAEPANVTGSIGEMLEVKHLKDTALINVYDPNLTKSISYGKCLVGTYSSFRELLRGVNEDVVSIGRYRRDYPIKFVLNMKDLSDVAELLTIDLARAQNMEEHLSVNFRESVAIYSDGKLRYVIPVYPSS